MLYQCAVEIIFEKWDEYPNISMDRGIEIYYSW